MLKRLTNNRGPVPLAAASGRVLHPCLSEPSDAMLLMASPYSSTSLVKRIFSSKSLLLQMISGDSKYHLDGGHPTEHDRAGFLSRKSRELHIKKYTPPLVVPL